MPVAFINVLLHAFASAPELIGDLETLMSTNWSHPTVQSAVAGVQAVGDVVARVSAAQAAPAADPTGTVTAQAGPANVGQA